MRNIQLQSPDYARVTGYSWPFTHMTILEEKSIIDCLLLTDWNCNILICDIRLFNNVPAHSHKQVPWKKLTIQSSRVFLCDWHCQISSADRSMCIDPVILSRWWISPHRGCHKIVFYDRSNRVETLCSTRGNTRHIEFQPPDNPGISRCSGPQLVSYWEWQSMSLDNMAIISPKLEIQQFTFIFT